MLDRFIAEQGMVRLAYQAARIPAYARWVRPHKRFRGGHVFLVGDAAGHVKVSTVGGIYTGFRGAKAIADIIVGGDHSELRALRGELGRHLLVRTLLSRFATDDYRRLFRILEHGSADTLSRHTRDDSRGLLLRLILREPRLLLLGLRTLVTGNLGSRSLPPRTDAGVPAVRYGRAGSAVR
jgi:flavin-dependent dehydrogenase